MQARYSRASGNDTCSQCFGKDLKSNESVHQAVGIIEFVKVVVQAGENYASL